MIQNRQPTLRFLKSQKIINYRSQGSGCWFLALGRFLYCIIFLSDVQINSFSDGGSLEGREYGTLHLNVLAMGMYRDGNECEQCLDETV